MEVFQTILVAFLSLATLAPAHPAFNGFEGSASPCSVTLEDVGTRNGIIDKNLRWPNGVVYYKFANDSTDLERRIISSGMKDISSKTCITFHERVNQDDYIQFSHQSGSGCNSAVGMQGGVQLIHLEKNNVCMTGHTAAHELMHALGFIHEHQRYDRDEHIQVFLNNVNETAWRNFDKASPKEYKNYGPYDVNSVMHYWGTAFTMNGLPTMASIDNPLHVLGNWYGLTQGDVDKIRKLYECA